MVNQASNRRPARGYERVFGRPVGGLATVDLGGHAVSWHCVSVGEGGLREVLRAAFHEAVPLVEHNLPVTERRHPVIAATPALAKNAALVEALTDALRARGVNGLLAALCAQAGMDTYSIAIRRWGADRTNDLHAHLDQAFTDLRLAANALR